MANIIEHLNNKEYAKVLGFCERERKKTPDDFNLAIIQGWCLFHLGRTDEAKACVDQGILADDLQLLSIKLAQDFFFLTNDYEQMCASSLQHIITHPKDPDLWYRLGLSRAILGDEKQAIEDFRHLLSFSDHPRAKTNLGGLLLNQGQYQEGFALFESRFITHDHCAWFDGDSVGIVPWQGESLSGKSLLIWSEQGLGDTLQFVRLSQRLIQMGAQVNILLKESHKGLLSLMQTVEGIDKVYITDNGQYTLPKGIDYHCSIMSLAYRLDINDNNIPNHTPYLAALTAHHSRWDFLRQYTGVKIGLVWSTLTKVDGYQIKEQLGTHEQYKNIPLASLQPLLDTKSSSGLALHFFTLQYPVTDNDSPWLKAHGVHDLSGHIRHFGDTADICAHMDIVVSIDTSVVHLAGALNKPVINLLPYMHDWRWRNHGQDHDQHSRWYPSMRLLRQKAKGQWEPVIAQAQELIIQWCDKTSDEDAWRLGS